MEWTIEERSDYERVWRFIASDIRDHQVVLHTELHAAEHDKDTVIVSSTSNPELHKALTKEFLGAKDVKCLPAHPLHVDHQRGRKHKYMHHAVQSFLAATSRDFVKHYTRTVTPTATPDDLHIIRKAIVDIYRHGKVHDRRHFMSVNDCDIFLVDAKTYVVDRVVFQVHVNKAVGRHIVAMMHTNVQQRCIRENVTLQSVDAILARIFGVSQ